MIGTIPNSHPDVTTTVTLATPCAGLCPHSGEPQPGSVIRVTYQPAAVLLELHAIEQYLAAAKAGTEALDLETLAQRLALACAEALGVAVTVEAFYRLRNDLELHCNSSTAPEKTSDLQI